MDLYRALRSFSVVVEQGSFAGAARQLFCSGPQVTKEVKWLEEQLGVQLLHRTTRKLSLTEPGRSCYEYARQSLDNLEEFKRGLQQQDQQVAGSLRVSVSIGFGERCLIKPITAFLQRYPEVKLEVNFTNQFIDLVHEYYDLAIRTDHPANASYVTEKIFSGARSVFGSPDYFERYGLPQRPADLLQHRLIMHSAISNPARWYFKNGEFIKANASYLCNSIASMVSAAKGGVGCANMSSFHIKQELANGELVEVLQEFAPEPIDLFLCYPRQKVLPKRVQAFIRCIKEAIELEWC